MSKIQWNLNRNSEIFTQENAHENVVCEMPSISVSNLALTSKYNPSNHYIGYYKICKYAMNEIQLYHKKDTNVAWYCC